MILYWIVQSYPKFAPDNLNEEFSKQVIKFICIFISELNCAIKFLLAIDQVSSGIRATGLLRIDADSTPVHFIQDPLAISSNIHFVSTLASTVYFILAGFYKVLHQGFNLLYSILFD